MSKLDNYDSTSERVEAVSSYLCKCYNCDRTLINENASIDAVKQEIKGIVLSMEYLNTDGSEIYTWCCPICGTDGFLTNLN